MGFGDLVGKFFDGISKNTTDRYLEKASKKSQSTEQKEITTQAKNYHNELQEFDKWKVLEKEFEKEVKGLVGNELEKQIEKYTEARVSSFVKRTAWKDWDSNERTRFKQDEITKARKHMIETSIISKDEAVKKMKELKEFLDLTVISQEEFDKKSEPLKKIILGE